MKENETIYSLRFIVNERGMCDKHTIEKGVTFIQKKENMV